MYSGEGYCKSSFRAGATPRVKRSLTIWFCMVILMVAGTSFERVRANAGDSTPATNAGEWGDTIALTILNDVLYTIEKSGALYRTDLNNGKWVQVGKAEFANTQFMFGDRQSLYTIETDGSLYRVSPSDGTWSRIGQSGDWKDTGALAKLNNSLYSIEKTGVLYRTDLTSGRWVQLGKAEFANTRFMFAAGLNLYTIETDGSLYRVNPQNGTWSGVGKPGEWKDTIVGTTVKGTIYTVETDGVLYETDPMTGLWKQIGTEDFSKIQFIFGAGGSVYSIEDGDLYQINTNTGTRTAIGK